MQILVTGGAGFIGSHVVRRLLGLGRGVRVLDNLSTGHASNLSPVAGEIDFIEGDIRDLDTLRGAVAGCAAIVHIAAVPSVPRSLADPATSHEANATGTLNVLLAARDAGVRRVVTASSSSIYGAVAELPKREAMAPLPISPYAVSKLAAESYCRSFWEVFELETVALRYFNVFGPRQDPNSEYAAVIPRFIEAFRRGQAPLIHGDGEQSRDFTYVDNVVDANLLALDTPGVGGRVYNIACGGRITLNQLAASIKGELGATVEAVHGPPRPGDVRHSEADISRARTELGYEPRVSLRDGLRRTVAHYVSEQEETSRRRRGSLRQVALTTSPSGAEDSKHLPASSSRHGGRYLITGGAGFIGSHLVDALLRRPGVEQIVVLDDLSTGNLRNLEAPLASGQLKLVHGSVTDAAVVDELMSEADVCVHLASAVGVQMIVEEPLDTLMRSVRGSNVVMRAAERHRTRVLFSSTSEVYGKQSCSSLAEDSDLVLGPPSRGRWTYAIAKTFGEALISGYHLQRGVDATVVRLFNTVGARQTGQYGMVLPRFVRQALRGEDLTVYGSGAQTRCFTHVRDTVAALLALCEAEELRGGTFNIGSSEPVAIVELARRVVERTGSRSGIVLVPYELAYGDGFEELGQRQPDTSALRSLTGWQPRSTLDDAIDDVIAHARSLSTPAESQQQAAAENNVAETADVA